MSKNGDERAWVEVDAAALRSNYETVRAHAGSSASIIPMVKADGYGLGAEWVTRTLEPLEPWGYGVATAREGAALRDAGVNRPVVVFSPLAPGDVALAAERDLTASISDIGGLDRWASAAGSVGRKLPMHVEVDTGMGRCGFDWRETPEWSAAVRARLGGGLRWEGVFTHFHAADAADGGPSATQWERFQDSLAQLPVSREDLFVHACNSAAALRWPEYAADAVRPGIFLYGGHPASELGSEVPAPAPVARLRARILLIRDVAPGTTVGYGATHAARGWERWATLGIGYGDGLPRALGNRGAAALRGRLLPIVGRVSMDLTVVDVTNVPDAAVGDAVTLIGRAGGADVPLEHVAAHADTIAYEILTGLTRRVPRLEVGGGAPPDDERPGD